ncbi:MAG: MBL fold metallo-hydrolase [Deltaproteobacteria bacterium]|nr:MBL fold metallo-hydrolase [Deltaproteobacteria bacterium]
MLVLAGHAVQAVSVGGLETCVQFPGLDLAFDIGRCPRSAVQRSRVLITHAHLDHLGGIAMHAATRALTGLEPPLYLVPAEVVPDLEALLATWRRLDRSRLPCRIVPCRPGDTLSLGRDLEVRAYRSDHVVPSIGYALWSRKHRLKPEYRSLPGSAIRDLRYAGTQVAEEVWTPDLAVPGDTRIDLLDQEPTLLDARLLVLEATFLDERVTVAQCREKGHIHLDEIAARASDFRNQAILLTHFSARYTPAEVRALLDQRLPRDLRRRVTPLLPRDAR